MTTKLDLDELNEALRGVADPVRLFPVRLYLLDKHLHLEIERWLDSVILQPLRRIAPNDRWHGPYGFDRDNFFTERIASETADEDDTAAQFVADLDSCGLQEAIVYLSDAAFCHDVRLFAPAILALCNELRKLYAANQLALLSSPDPETVDFLTRIAVRDGEFLPLTDDECGLNVLRGHMIRVGAAIYAKGVADADAWMLEVIKAMGCAPEDMGTGLVVAELMRVFGVEWNAYLAKLYAACAKGDLSVMAPPKPRGRPRKTHAIKSPAPTSGTRRALEKSAQRKFGPAAGGEAVVVESAGQGLLF